jgi:hypothetical protein
LIMVGAVHNHVVLWLIEQTQLLLFDCFKGLIVTSVTKGWTQTFSGNKCIFCIFLKKPVLKELTWCYTASQGFIHNFAP